jgi:creatinine amidohydrolase
VSEAQAREAARARAALRERFAAAPDLVRRALDAPPPALHFDPRALRRIRTTGIGSSESHARALAFLLAERFGLDARFTPTGALAAGAPEGSERDALVVFSQGLSPNARYALAEPARWRSVLLVTAATPQGAGAGAAAWLAALESAGVARLPIEPENEFDGLVRIQGPLTGLAAALRVARAVGRALGREDALESAPPADVARRIAGAEATLDAALAGEPAALARPFALLATGGYAELASNLRQKLLEGLLLSLPPVWDLLEFAHGPFQQRFERETTFLALARADAPGEAEWLARARALLRPERHALVTLPATLPGVYALFEHEALLDALVLRQQRAQGIDPLRWPGRGHDAALYRAAPERPATGAAPPPRAALASDLAGLVWPELETRLCADSVAVVPLGALEQHGAHLPFATDAWIADALAERFCAEVPGAVRLPALALGCSQEHAAFPGTLSLSEETFAAALAEVVADLARHGFARVFLFSAHGGNAGPLQRALPRLREAAAAGRPRGAPPARVSAHVDLAGLTRTLQQVAAEHGIGPGAAGHHAGEIETSMLLWLRPAAVRREALAPGTRVDGPDAQALFYPSLRPHAPEGTVGDPTQADPARAAAYLDAWAELLVAKLTERAPR